MATLAATNYQPVLGNPPGNQLLASPPGLALVGSSLNIDNLPTKRPHTLGRRAFHKLSCLFTLRKGHRHVDTTVVAQPKSKSPVSPSNITSTSQPLTSAPVIQTMPTTVLPDGRDIASTSTENEISPNPLPLSSNQTSTIASQHLVSANAQATATKDPQKKNGFVTSGSKRVNASIALEVVKLISDMLVHVPFAKAGAGLAIIGIEMSKEVDACKEEWDKVTESLERVQGKVSLFQPQIIDNPAFTLDSDANAAIIVLKKDLLDIFESVIRYKDVEVLRQVFMRKALKDEATSCLVRIDNAEKDFNMKISFDILLQVHDIKRIISSQGRQTLPVFHDLQSSQSPNTARGDPQEQTTELPTSRERHGTSDDIPFTDTEQQDILEAHNNKALAITNLTNNQNPDASIITQMTGNKRTIEGVRIENLPELAAFLRSEQYPIQSAGIINAGSGESKSTIITNEGNELVINFKE